MWDYVIEALPVGLDVLVADLPTCRRAGVTLRDDSEHVHDLAAGRPSMLVGHSYGGAVITEAGAQLPELQYLLYLAAPMPDIGETMFEWLMKRPGRERPMEFLPDGTAMMVPDGPSPYDDLTTQRIMEIGLRPFAVNAVFEQLTSAAWRSVPSGYVIASQDTMFHPDTQREMSERAGSVTQIASEHQLIMSDPEAVADLIVKALQV
jgi:pimeloyl-ACP methyl ester carboxylesterase